LGLGGKTNATVGSRSGECGGREDASPLMVYVSSALAAESESEREREREDLPDSKSQMRSCLQQLSPLRVLSLRGNYLFSHELPKNT